ncbi:AAA family ATPase [Aquisalinus flavus]|uniref:ATPase n=1 Tax=Aquisalinus flavus TaxID=1526572 RepID=A0A8J2V206_9PROT|nr:MoxR family ATPase [Aquisalinus flavus]MBD0426846.1 MoxR family ATPase [Aquisalinus flavus]UNE46693.1 MoxR family ATPase [Aquisalinus flavus]GGC96449.1 ATPase [Aquisalinus flavus]
MAVDGGQADDILEEFEQLSVKLRTVRGSLGEVIFGQEDVINEVLTALVAGGHALLVGAPGLAKTLLVTSMATVTGLADKRVQFTPDLMPADVLGAEVLEEAQTGERSFRFIKGPIFCQLLMADEINRASPRTQSALLQAMQEHHVTIAGERRDLPEPFHVLATQNPIEQEGTYPLPEAQLDRFLLQVNVDYPSEAAERQMLAATTGTVKKQLTAVMGPADLMAAQAMVRKMPIGEKLVDAILRLVRAARPVGDGSGRMDETIAWGPGPRASQALSLAMRARALIDEREAPSLDDLAALASPVLRHRMALTFRARAEGLTTDKVIADLVKREV